MIGATFCSGIGAPEMAAPWIDWRLASEIEDFPREVLLHRFGHKTPEDHNQGEPLLWGDMTEVTPELMRRRGIPLPDLIVAGTPCFTAGHLVLTDRGHIPIEDIKRGDLVATHKGRFKKVLRTGSKRAEVGVWKGVGVSQGITCTADHPFLTAADKSHTTRINGKSVRVPEIGDMEWKAASDTPGAFWASISSFSADHPPTIPLPHGLSHSDTLCLIGWYLGDGWIRTWANGRKAIVLGLSEQKVSAFRKRFPSLKQADVANGSTRKIAIGCTELCRWIEAHFGHGAAAKTIPGFILGDRDRASLLDGYVATDGSTSSSGIITINSVSESLARGATALAQTVGYVASVTKQETADTTIIEGREVSQRDYFQCRMYPEAISRKSKFGHGYILRKAQSFTPCGTETVFNIEVDGDNSFILNGVVVHNCQSFSIAGLRKGTADARGNLTLKFVEICHDIVAARPDGKLAVLWENVPGVLSDKGNAFGCFLGGLVGADDAIPSPDGGSWPSAGMVSGPQSRIGWRVLDAQYFGVAQRRRRVFAVIDFGGALDPAAVLFERKGLHGDHPPRREAGEGIAPTVSARAQGGGGLGTDFDCDGGLISHEVAATLNAHFGDKLGLENQHIDGGCSHFVAHALSAEGYDASEDGTGRGTPLVPVAGAICRDSFSGGTSGRPEGAAVGHFIPVAFSSKDHGADAMPNLSPTLRAGGHAGSHPNAGIPPAVTTPWAVRRLSPRECERLQGFPDNHTLIPRARKRTLSAEALADEMRYLRDTWPDLSEDEARRLAADGPRYKALGNSMAVPCIKWIIDRMKLSMESHQ